MCLLTWMKRSGVPGTVTASPSIIVEDLWIRFMIRYFQREVTLRETLIRGLRPGRRWREQFWALRGINLTAYPGDVVGLIGANGSGKTTLLKTLAGVFGADRGRAIVRGKTASLLSFGIGFNPNLSGHENIYLNASLLGMSKRTIDDRIERIVDFSELGKFIQAPVRTYSAGMRARLGFSIAIETDPDVLLLDEALGAGDQAFRAKAGTTLERLRGDNKTVVLANHNLTLILESCTRVAWVDAGKIRMIGGPAEVVDAYRSSLKPKQEAAAGVAG